jgi:signal transduction histidine kinase
MVRIVSDLLVFARRGHPPLEIVRITDLIDEAIKAVDSCSDVAKVEIKRDYQDGVPEVRAGNLFQVFFNLIKNAFDAMPNGGRLHVTSRVDGDMIVAEFADTGIGFSPEDAEVIFEPFYTTKQKDKGTGLGLAVCKDIIDRCGGRIAARNATGGGSIFTVYLPLQQGVTNNL